MQSSFPSKVNRTCGRSPWLKRSHSVFRSARSGMLGTRVKANRGAAGVDEESIVQFERRLKLNLYKIWNRMSSGTYFPPPVRIVKIPKSGSGERMLGIPTVGDRVAQTALKLYLEPVVEPRFHRDSYG